MMYFTANTQATTQVLLVLAQQEALSPLTVCDISASCCLHQSNVVAILEQSQRTGLVKKSNNGYVLAHPPQDITFLCIAKVAEECAGCQCEGKSEDSCNRADHCPTRRIRNLAQIMLEEALESISLIDFISKK